MKFKSLVLAASVAASFSAIADVVPTLPGGPLYIKFDGAEQIAIKGDTGYANEINWGVLVLSGIAPGAVTGPNTIQPKPGSFFANGGVNGQITGIFYGVTNPISNTANNAFPASGGFLDLYWRDTSVYGTTDLTTASPVVRTAQDKASGYTEGSLLVRLAFASGINADPNVFINGTQAPSTQGFGGQATSFANVVTGQGGLWEEKFNTDWFTTAFGQRDFRFRNTYEYQGTWNGDTTGCDQGTGKNCVLGANITDPATVVALPEPASLALVGLGLIAAGTARRRRNKA